MTQPADRARLHAIIRGTVQGVGFRANTQRRAAALRITGWVRNRPDGSVEVVAEGHQPDLKEFEHFLKQGPAAAFVNEAQISYEDWQDEFSGFNVRY